MLPRWRSRNRHSLALSTGQFVRSPRAFRREPDSRSAIHCLRIDYLLRKPPRHHVRCPAAGGCFLRVCAGTALAWRAAAHQRFTGIQWTKRSEIRRRDDEERKRRKSRARLITGRPPTRGLRDQVTSESGKIVAHSYR